MSQEAEIRQVLVFENRDKPGMSLVPELQKSSSPHPYRIVTITEMDAARELLRTRSIAMAVINVGREIGEAQSMLRSIARGFPSLPLLVFNGFMIPGIAEKAREYGQVQYCEDPQDMQRLISRMLSGLQDGKRGVIDGIHLDNMLGWLRSESFSGQVIVGSGGRKGILLFHEGLLRGARSGDGRDDGTMLADMSSWDEVSVEIREGDFAAAFPPAKASGTAERRRSLAGDGSVIESLRLPRGTHFIDIRMQTLGRVVATVRDILQDSLLRMDIFLSTDGRSLAGWRSHPLACSRFAGVTRALAIALSASDFPPLGKYYLLDLAENRLALIIVCGEIQVGMLLSRGDTPLGRLTNILLPRVTAAMEGAYSFAYPA